MRRLVALVIAAALGLGAAPAGAAPKIRVVTTIADLRALTEAVGGDLVTVDSLARGNQNPHDLEVRPSLMVKVRRADLLVVNGLELDAWAEVVVQGANNPRVIPGAPGRVDASRGVPVLEIPPGRVDRSMGDVHPSGNPHYTLDPALVAIAIANIEEGLARVTPEHRAVFERNRRAFLGRLEEAMARWSRTLGPARGAKVVVYHNNWVYFLARFGLVQAGTIEERPGIPPGPGHLTQLIRRMKDEGVRLVLVEPWNDRRLAERVAEDAGAKALVLASSVGTATGSYIEAIDAIVTALGRALR